MTLPDERFMALALSLGQRGLGHVWPNPAVGCVIAKDGRIIGRGWTQAGGRPHAETVALAQAGEAARGATAYVGLEPCAHHGRTPPCAEALAAAGVARVVTGLTDPDPRVSGRGHAILREAGIEVVEGVLQDQAALANRGFLARVGKGRPWVTLKLASSLDGRIATASGESRWITGPAARRRVHLMRLRSDAVMVGAGTARTDDPDLRVRDLGAARQPVRIVLDGRLSLSPESRLGLSAAKAPVWIVHGAAADAAARRAWTDLGAELIECGTDATGAVDLARALEALGRRGLTRVLCEGGATLAAALIRADLADEIVWFTAGMLIGAEGLPAIGGLDLAVLAGAPRFRLTGREILDGDVLHRWMRSPANPL